MLSIEQYLELERAAERKSEYFDGLAVPVPDADLVHGLIVVNLIGSLAPQLRTHGHCGVCCDMRVQAGLKGPLVYPDIIVIAGECRFADDRQDTLLNPTVVIEVVSDCTELSDRVRKFDCYTSMDSIAEYGLVATDRISFDLFTRCQNGRWQLGKHLRIEDSVSLESIDCVL